MARAKVSNYSMNLSEDKTQSPNWEFDVHQEELLTRAGNPTGIHAVVRDDTGQYIGDYKGEKMLSYKDIVSAFEAGLQKAGLEFTRKLFCTGHGARFFGQYNVGGMKINGEKFDRILDLQSSHNGTLKVGFRFSGLKLACLNKAEMMSLLYEMMKKHSEEMNLDFLAKEIETALARGQGELTDMVNRMLGKTLNDGQTENILSNLVEMGGSIGVSPRMAHVVNHYWHHPQNDEASFGNTLYRLYNCMTRFCRDVANLKRFEMATRANRYVTGALDLAAQRDNDFARLIAMPQSPLDFKAVTVELPKATASVEIVHVTASGHEVTGNDFARLLNK